jgi:hypothetical protein
MFEGCNHHCALKSSILSVFYLRSTTPTFSCLPHPRIALMGLDGRSSPLAND